MKVLFLTRYVYDERILEFSKNKTGLGMMVKDIAEHVSSYDDVRLLTRVITKGRDFNSYKVLRHNWKDVFGSIYIRDLLYGIRKALSIKQPNKDLLRYIYFYLDSGYVRKTIKSLMPDIVHIHGIEYCTEAYIKVCKDLKVPYVVTLHGLIGLNDSVQISKQERQLERDFLVKSERENIPVSVISSGIKRRILNNYGLKNGNNIKVIINGTKTERVISNSYNIRKKHSIPIDHKIILCVGNVSINKNQLQIVKALTKIQSQYEGKITVLFIGNDTNDSLLKNAIANSETNIKFIYCGFIERNLISSYWKIADLNIFPSLNDGFGLSIIEGFVHGVPTLAFSDLDAIEDLYDQNAMLLIDERSDLALVRGIDMALQINWDNEWIMEYSEKFSIDKVAENYHNLYLDITKKL